MTDTPEETGQGMTFAQALNLYVSHFSIVRAYDGAPMKANELTSGLVYVLGMVLSQFDLEDRKKLVEACCDALTDFCGCGKEQPKRSSLN